MTPHSLLPHKKLFLQPLKRIALFFDHYLLSAVEILDHYDGTVPMHHVLKGWFKTQRKFGSRDRKMISAMVYHGLRTGHALVKYGWEDRILAGGLLCADVFAGQYLRHFRPHWVDQLYVPFADKLAFLHGQKIRFSIEKHFPFHPALSEGVSMEALVESYFTQPRVYLRIRRGAAEIRRILTDRLIDARWEGEHTVGLPAGVNVEDLLPDAGAYTIQDWASQQAALQFDPAKGESWWDCCAASGGKSLCLLDEEPGIKLLCSDVRASILLNLKGRLNSYQHHRFSTKQLDLSAPYLEVEMKQQRFDAIAADVPCSGSGTWARTPEQLLFFTPEKLETYTTLQQKIARNVAPYVKTGGRLFYITCSVFRAENEDRVADLVLHSGLKVVSQQLFSGINKEADNLFIARLEK